VAEAYKRPAQLLTSAGVRRVVGGWQMTVSDALQEHPKVHSLMGANVAWAESPNPSTTAIPMGWADAGPARSAKSWSVERVAQMTIMLVIGAAAGAGSFRHIHDVAAAHGQAGWLAWADAVVLELMSVASGLELRRRKRCRTSVSFPAAVMVAAVTLSLSAQVVEAEPSVVGWITAAIPALGFLVMVKIALAQAGGQQQPPVVLATDALPSTEPEPKLTSLEAEATDTHGASSPTDDDATVVALVPVAREAALMLNREGRRLSRQALAARLREGGHLVSNARACALLKVLKSDPPQDFATL
jgi:hypothetical protein